jgi:hypothetical protein
VALFNWRALVVVSSALLIACRSASVSAPASPRDPVDVILRAFDDHEVVALGEGSHGNLPSHELRLRLIRNPAFRAQVDDIVVEFGNSRYQELVDRFVSGEAVDAGELRKVWQDTAQANAVWDAPIYREFFEAVRQVNAGSPRDQQLRIVLGDVPFDWGQVRTLADYQRQPQRNDQAVAGIIRKESAAQGRRVLVIYGDLHLLRRPALLKPSGWQLRHRHVVSDEKSIVALLEEAGVRVFSIYTNTFADLTTLQSDVASWRQPAITMLTGTVLGSTPFGTYSPSPTMIDGRWMTIDDAHSPSMEQQFDALLFVGPPSAIRYATPSPELCHDADYLEMRLFRMNLVGMRAQAEQAKQFCRRVGR